jgi:hypothetical protein
MVRKDVDVGQLLDRHGDGLLMCDNHRQAAKTDQRADGEDQRIDPENADQ